MKAGLIVASTAFLVFSAPVMGQSRPSLDGMEADRGETELEFQTRISDTRKGTGLKYQLQAKHAVSGRWTLGGEIEFEDKPGETLLAETAVARLKWRAPRMQNGVGIALRIGAGYDFQKDAAVLETAAFVGWSAGDWSIIGKFDMEQLVKDREKPEFAYRVEMGHELASDVEIGIKGFGDLWQKDKPKHQIGPFVEFPLGRKGAPALELGAFAGLTKDAPDMQYRVEIELEF